MADTLHNCRAGAYGEVHLVGNLHAASVVMHLEHRVRQLHGALRHLFESKLQAFAGPAPQEHVEHTQAVLQTTVMRARTMIRARAGSDFAGGEDEGELALQFRPLADLLNMDIRRPVVQHYCTGCCTGNDGATTRERQVKNVVAA